MQEKLKILLKTYQQYLSKKDFNLDLDELNALKIVVSFLEDAVKDNVLDYNRIKNIKASRHNTLSDEIAVEMWQDIVVEM